MVLASANSSAIVRGRRYVRAPVPLVFPVSESVPESRWHRRLCELLAESIERALAGGGLVSSDQFLYWDPADPKRCLAPDVAVRVGTPHELLKHWKTWERGAPHVGVEIVSDVDASELRFEEKLERYRCAGIGEIVRFERESSEPIRIWDWVDGDVVERDLADPEALRSDALGAFWCCHTDPELGVMLRLSKDRDGSEIWPTHAEAERAAREAERAAREAERAAREVERAAKEAALARVAELEAELARLR
jgi:hypothetical protein